MQLWDQGKTLKRVVVLRAAPKSSSSFKSETGRFKPAPGAICGQSHASRCEEFLLVLLAASLSSTSGSLCLYEPQARPNHPKRTLLPTTLTTHLQMLQR